MYTEGVCRTFVPEGLKDGSDSTELAEVQAIHCLGSPALKTRPVRVRYDHVSQGWFGVYDGKKPIERPIILCPTGRIRYRTDFPGISCLATII